MDGRKRPLSGQRDEESPSLRSCCVCEAVGGIEVQIVLEILLARAAAEKKFWSVLRLQVPRT